MHSIGKFHVSEKQNRLTFLTAQLLTSDKVSHKEIDWGPPQEEFLEANIVTEFKPSPVKSMDSSKSLSWVPRRSG